MASYNKIIFPYNTDSKDFEPFTYTPEMTGGRANSEEVKDILEKVGGVIRKKDELIWDLFRFGTAALGAVNGLVLLTYFKPEMWQKYKFYGAGITAITVNCFIGFVFWQEQQAKLVTQGVFDHYNSQSFEKKGLRWQTPKDFPHWVELWKDYELYNQNRRL